MKLRKLGVWVSLHGLTAEAGLEIAKRIEQFGYAALWMPESRGRNVLVHSAWLLAGTTKLVVASGIANIYARGRDGDGQCPTWTECRHRAVPVTTVIWHGSH